MKLYSCKTKNIGSTNTLQEIIIRFTVGFPAKSGVGGGIAVPLVDRMGIGVFGPALDEKGNSAGGIKILEYLSNKMNISLF